MDIGRIVRHRAAPAAACVLLVALIYQILGNWSVAGDALRASAAGIASAACLLWAGRQGARVPRGRRDRSAALPCLLCLCGSVASVAVPLAPGTIELNAPSAILCAVLALSCVGTAVWEEVLFRSLFFDLAAAELGTLKAALACSAVFAALHCGAAGDVASGVLRFAQVFSFGFAMAGIVAGTRRGLVWAIATHALYDLICFAPALMDATGLARGTDPWFLPAQLLAALETIVPGMAASLVFLIPAALWAYAKIRDGKN